MNELWRCRYNNYARSAQEPVSRCNASMHAGCAVPSIFQSAPGSDPATTAPLRERAVVTICNVESKWFNVRWRGALPARLSQGVG